MKMRLLSASPLVDFEQVFRLRAGRCSQPIETRRLSFDRRVAR